MILLTTLTTFDKIYLSVGIGTGVVIGVIVAMLMIATRDSE